MRPEDLVSPGYQAMLREMHVGHWRTKGDHFFGIIMETCGLLVTERPQILDYGSGGRRLAAAVKTRRPDLPVRRAGGRLRGYGSRPPAIRSSRI